MLQTRAKIWKWLLERIRANLIYVYSLACPYRNASIGVHLEHVVRPPSDRYQHRCLCSSQWAGRRCSSYAKLQVIPDTISNVGSWPLYQSKFLFYSSIYIFCNSTQSAKAGFLTSLNNFEDENKILHKNDIGNVR